MRRRAKEGRSRVSVRYRYPARSPDEAASMDAGGSDRTSWRAKIQTNILLVTSRPSMQNEYSEGSVR